MSDRWAGHISLPREQAVRRMLNVITAQMETEIVPLEDAGDRILAENIYAQYDLPGKLTSRLDGVAVYYADFAGGMPDTSAWKENQQYVFCNTGIAIKGDYDTVIRIEQIRFNEQGQIQILEVPKKGQLTIAPGSRMKAGDLILPAGCLLGPWLLAAAASGGHDRISVVKKPKVAFIPTGSELVPPGSKLKPENNFDSNSVMIRTKLRDWGAIPLCFPIVPDDPEKLTEAMKQALQQADIVIINAGSSKGSDDFTIPLLESFGTVICHEVDHGPGKHTSYTISHEKKPIVGLSGPPGGAESTADFYVKPLIDRYLGLPYRKPPIVEAVLTDKADPKKDVDFMLRVRVVRTDDGYAAIPQELGQSAGAVEADSQNGYLCVPAFSSFEKGAKVKIELRYPYAFI